MHLRKSKVCSNELDVQEANCSLTKFVNSTPHPHALSTEHFSRACISWLQCTHRSELFSCALCQKASIVNCAPCFILHDIGRNRKWPKSNWPNSKKKPGQSRNWPKSTTLMFAPRPQLAPVHNLHPSQNLHPSKTCTRPKLAPVQNLHPSQSCTHPKLAPSQNCTRPNLHPSKLAPVQKSELFIHKKQSHFHHDTNQDMIVKIIIGGSRSEHRCAIRVSELLAGEDCCTRQASIRLLSSSFVSSLD